MFLNQLEPGLGSKRPRRRVGRGIGSGLGKTCGRGHKGQKSRAGGYHKVGFEGGQMPIQRRLPKVGFTSLTRGDTHEVHLSELEKINLDLEVIDLLVLKVFGIVPAQKSRAKVILSGSISRPIQLRGIAVTKGARLAIENLGGKILDL